MSADRLREAAKVLRERAEAASQDAAAPWVATGTTVEAYDGVQIETAFGEANPGMECEPDSVSTYIATMHPGVGLALADWLDAEAIEEQYGHDPHDFTDSRIIADLILGSAP